MKSLATAVTVLSKLASSYDLFEKSPLRIIGGSVTDESRYPYMVAFVNKTDGMLVCGGSLVARDTVLTAAHCAAGIPYTDALIGRHDIFGLDGEEIALDRVIVHPEYSSITNANDYALAMLAQPTSLETEFAQLNNDASLPALGDVARAMGWGVMGQINQTIVTSEYLLETDLSVISDDDCLALSEVYFDAVSDVLIEDLFTQYFDDDTFTGAISSILEDDDFVDSPFDSENMFCTLEQGQDACYGDSGGPLIMPGSSANHDVIIGLVSWGVGCAQPGMPGVFSRVSYAYDWIKETTCSTSIDPPDYLCRTTASAEPTSDPTGSPSSKALTFSPSETPTIKPTIEPTSEPSAAPEPTKPPTSDLIVASPSSKTPTFSPSETPTIKPTIKPTSEPSTVPEPTKPPTSDPTTALPTFGSSETPTASLLISFTPSALPSEEETESNKGGPVPYGSPLNADSNSVTIPIASLESAPKLPISPLAGTPEPTPNGVVWFSSSANGWLFSGFLFSWMLLLG